MAELGCADEYIVHLEDMHDIQAPWDFEGELQPVTPRAVLHEFDWSSIKWGRVKNEVSIAQVTLARDVAGSSCCTYPLVGWEQCLAIYRNGVRVWSGPLMGWTYENGDITLIAHDLFAFAKKAHLPVDFWEVDEELRFVIATLIEDVAGSWGSPVPWQNLHPLNVPPSAISGGGSLQVLVNRQFVYRQLKTLFSIFTEFVSDYGLSFTAVADFVSYDPEQFNLGRFAPTLSEQSTSTAPKITVDCTDVAIDNFTASVNAGVGGYQRIDSTVLAASFASDPPSYTEWNLQTTAQPDARLARYWSAYAGYPSAVSTLRPLMTVENLRLLPNFGSIGLNDSIEFEGINHLVPGLRARWGFDLDCLRDVGVARFGEVTSEYISYGIDPYIRHVCLEQMDVEVHRGDDGLVETINTAWVPMVWFNDPDDDGSNIHLILTSEIPLDPPS